MQQPTFPLIIKPTKTRPVEFWISSSRGTNARQLIMVTPDMTQRDIRDKLESWCSQFGAWHVSENFVSYGYDDPVEAA